MKLLLLILILSAGSLRGDNLSVLPGAPEAVDVSVALSAMVAQVINSPASLLVIVALSMFAYLIEVTWVPTKILPWFCLIGGGLLYFLFSNRASVPAAFPYPYAVLFVNGMICGGVALTVHAQVVMRWLVKPAPPTP